MVTRRFEEGDRVMFWHVAYDAYGRVLQTWNHLQGRVGTVVGTGTHACTVQFEGYVDNGPEDKNGNRIENPKIGVSYSALRPADLLATVEDVDTYLNGEPET